ncbi:MAG: peptidase M1 [Bacteroidetes bacterium B1(2017)]|nr:MAG: peptidase M1 [Bacteroidetes bacterium B1(2017)]
MKLKVVFCFVLAAIVAFPLAAKTPKLKANYDILSYQISLKVLPQSKRIEGQNIIQIVALKSLTKIELDLFPQLSITGVNFGNGNLPVQRDSNSFIISFPKSLKKGDTVSFAVNYVGMPIIAKKAPWDGGFVWDKDSDGKPWIGLACEGLGASCWLPCKDQWNDEPNWVKVKVIVPQGLIGVSNGKLVGQLKRPDGFSEFDWYVSSPINHYNISINVANYEHIEDVYLNAKGERLSLNYYVLAKNFVVAKTHFQQVKRMLQTFEGYFGLYPFYEDGYKLVETPYWGMEHQSCVAYGNNYENNKFGFDFIIVHESGHEWFANSLTASDKADMWIHESFTTYSEALYVEKQFGSPRAIQYLEGQKGNIKNKLPMIGPRDINYERPDNDLYYKGTWILHTMRSILDNDTLWFNTLKDLNQHFYHQTITSKQVEDFLIKRTGYDFGTFFKQYLYVAELPEVQYFMIEKNGLNELHYRLNAKEKRLKLPVKVTLGKEKFDFLVFDNKWRIYDLPYTNSADFLVDQKHFLLKVKQIEKN